MTGHAYVTNLSAYLPNAPVDNDDMESLLGLVGGRPSRARRLVLRSNGITSRHYAIDRKNGEPTHTNAELAAAAIRGLADAHRRLDEIDLLCCGTTLPDQTIPGHANMVHGELGIPACENVSTSGVCISSTMALKYAMLAVRGGVSRCAASVGSERSSAVMRARNFQGEYDARVESLKKDAGVAFHKDFLRWMLSDGAGAALVEPAPRAVGLSLRIDWIVERSYANEQPVCMYGGAEKREDGGLEGWLDVDPSEWAARSVFAVKQDVKQLNAHVLHYTVERPLREIPELVALDPDAVDWFLPHYSSHYFRDGVRTHMLKANFDIPCERWFTNLYSKGNTGSASIYIMLDELFHSGKLRVGQSLLCYVPESGRLNTAWIHLTVCDRAS